MTLLKYLCFVLLDYSVWSILNKLNFWEVFSMILLFLRQCFPCLDLKLLNAGFFQCIYVVKTQIITSLEYKVSIMGCVWLDDWLNKLYRRLLGGEVYSRAIIWTKCLSFAQEQIVLCIGAGLGFAISKIQIWACRSI